MSFVIHHTGHKNLNGDNGDHITGIVDPNDDVKAERFISTIIDAPRLTSNAIMFGQIQALAPETGMHIQPDLISLKNNGNISAEFKSTEIVFDPQVKHKNLQVVLGFGHTATSGDEYGFIFDRVGQDNFRLNFEEDKPGLYSGLEGSRFKIARVDDPPSTFSISALVDKGIGYYDTTDDIFKFTGDMTYNSSTMITSVTNATIGTARINTALRVVPKFATLNYGNDLDIGENIDLRFNIQDDNTNPEFLRMDGTGLVFRMSNQPKGNTSEISRQENEMPNNRVPFFRTGVGANEFQSDAGITYNPAQQELTAENISVNNRIEALNTHGQIRRVLVDPTQNNDMVVGSVLAITSVNIFGGPEDFQYAWVRTSPPEDSNPSGTRRSGTDGGGGGGGGPLFPPGGGGPGGGSSDGDPPDDDPDPDPDPTPDDPTPLPPGSAPIAPPPTGSNARFIDPADQAVNGFCNDFVTQNAIKQFTRFRKLLDTPTDYIGFGNYLCKVALGEDGIEFTDVIELDDGTLINPSITFKNSTNNTGINLFGSTGISFVDNGANFLEVDPVNAKYEGVDWTFTNNAKVAKFLTIGNTGTGEHYIFPDSRPVDETQDHILVYQANTNSLEFEVLPTIAPTTYIALTDTDDVNYTGKAGYVPKVNPGESGLILSTTKFTDNTDTPSVYSAPDANLPLRVNPSFDGIIFKANTFLESSDVFEPDYTGHSGEFVVVRPGEDGLEFSTSIPGTTFVSLSDTPVDYTGSQYNTLVSTGSALEWSGQVLNSPGSFVKLRLLGNDRVDVNTSNTILRASDGVNRINLQATQTVLSLGGEDRIVLASTANSFEFGGFPRISIGNSNTLLRDLAGVIKFAVDNSGVSVYDGTLLYRLPTTAGTVGQVLTKDSGNTSSWQTPAGGISEVLTFGGGTTGDVATMTVTNGLITSRTLVP